MAKRKRRAFTTKLKAQAVRVVRESGKPVGTGYIEKVPKIRLGKEPEGRLRFLTEDEITRLLGAAAESQNTYFLPIVTIALNTGMRKNEILKLA